MVNVEIEDTLADNVASAIEDVEQLLRDYLAENPDKDKVPCLHNDLDYSGSVHEIIDSSVPIYTKEIKDTIYLHGNEVEEAFDSAGFGRDSDGRPEGGDKAAIYSYIEQEVCEWYHKNAEDIFDEVRGEDGQEDE